MKFLTRLWIAYIRKHLRKIVHRFNDADDFFWTIHRRPKRANQVHYSSSQALDPALNVGIVMQGQIVEKDILTLETIRLIRKFYPLVKIVLSTWEDGSESWNYDDPNFSLIRSKKPTNTGVSNINLQIHSTTQGLEQLEKMGCDFVLKMRTDQRFYNNNALSYMHGLLQTFPSRLPSMRNRLLTISLNTFKYRLYSPTDMFMFGHIEDMKNYWVIDQDERQITKLQIKKQSTDMLCISKMRLCEIYFATNFQEKIGRPILWTLQDSCNFYRDCLIVIDSSSIDFYWPKYELEKEFRRLAYSDRTDQELSFSDWMILQKQDFTSISTEIGLSLPFGRNISSTIISP